MRVNPVTGIYAEHDGIDLAAPMGTPIIATGDGVIGSAGWRGGYGLMVAVEHGSGVETRYGHMSQVAVAPGEQVRKGEIIGYVGSTGRSTGPHVHYETRINGHPVNPLSR
jgi:murein DD-endopeptidase MepM/ murein hydrolase activator NlpD